MDGSQAQLCLGAETVALHTAGEKEPSTREAAFSSMPVQRALKLPIEEKSLIAQ